MHCLKLVVICLQKHLGFSVIQIKNISEYILEMPQSGAKSILVLAGYGTKIILV